MGFAAADGTAQLRGEATHVTHHLGPQHLVRVRVGARGWVRVRVRVRVRVLGLGLGLGLGPPAGTMPPRTRSA